MTRSKGKASSPAPHKGKSPRTETPPALDAMVDRVLAYSPPSSKAKSKAGKKSKG